MRYSRLPGSLWCNPPAPGLIIIRLRTSHHFTERPDISLTFGVRNDPEVFIVSFTFLATTISLPAGTARLWAGHRKQVGQLCLILVIPHHTTPHFYPADDVFDRRDVQQIYFVVWPDESSAPFN